MKTPMALVVGAPVRRRRSRRVRAVASRVDVGATSPALLSAEERTELMADALARCLFDEIRSRREPPREVGK